MSETTHEAPEGQVRAFYPTDYRRFASAIRTARRDHGDLVADQLAAPITAALAADFEGFDTERFIRGTVIMPSYVPALSATLKTATHVKCSPWKAAPDAKVAKAQALAADLATVMDTLVEHFDSDTFTASVIPPRPATETAASVDEYDDPDDDEI